MMFIIVIKITINFLHIPSRTEMTPSEKESQTITDLESSHKLNDNKDNTDDVISETSSLHLYHNEWDERRLEHVQPTNFSFKDSLPQVSSSHHYDVKIMFFPNKNALNSEYGGWYNKFASHSSRI